MDNEKETLIFSICIPVYKGSHILGKALDSIFNQKFDGEFEVIIGEDTPLEFSNEIKKVEELIGEYDSSKIKYIKNQKNLTYAINLQNIVSLASGKYLFLMAQDDVLSPYALQKTYDAFLLDKDIGCVTRPYFWFMDNPNTPVRMITPYNQKKDAIVSVFKKDEFMKIFESLGQLSGLAYRRDFIEIPFNEECFPAHIYPFAGILRKYKCVFLKDYTVAVGILDSQTRSISSIYDLSPTESWLRMYNTVFAGEEFKQQRKWGVEHICGHNFEGLIQLKSYAKSGVLLKEIKILIKNRPINLLSFKFWVFVLILLLIPRFILIRVIDLYKAKINSRRVKKCFLHFDKTDLM